MVHLKGLVKTGFAALMVATLGAFSFPARAATITVTNLNDSGPGSLRAAIAAASSGDSINFAVTGTITLTSGALVITTGLTINGPGQANLAISGNNASAVFNVNSGSPVSISDLTIENGSNSLNGGGGGINSRFSTLAVANCTFSNNSTIDGSGGGIFFVSGTLTVTNSSFSSNTSVGGPFGGGAIFVSSATLTVTNSSFSSNTAGGFGGAIGRGAGSQESTSVTNSTFSNNTAGGSGGGIFAESPLTVTDSTFSGNSASNGGGAIWAGAGATFVINSTFSGNSTSGRGGAIENSGLGTLSVSNSTFSNNTATGALGGAIETDIGGSLAVSNSTFSGNSAASGGAVASFGITSGGFGILELKNSLFAKGASGGNCFVNQGAAGFISEGHNLSDDTSCGAFLTQAGDLNDTPAGLDPAGLRNNGGPTQTIALLPTSPAVDAIPVSDCTDTNGNPVATDQRGVARPQGSACDIGAFELAETRAASTATTVVAAPTTITLGDTVTFTATVTTATGTPTGLVTFFDGTAPLGSGMLGIVAGQSQASFSTSLLSAAASPHSVTAVYQGDATHTGSASSATSETVKPRASTTGVVLNPTTVVVGQPSTATVTVTDSGSMAPGTADTFTPTGAPTTGRTGFTSTLLADGLVLVAGGTDANNNVLSSAEIYSVSGAAFSATGNLNAARTGAVAVLLPNGKILIAGGSRNGLATGALNTAELFDPSAGTFTTSSNNMTAARFGATATLLNNGNVLVAGGENSGGALNSAELYNPSSDTFTASGNLNTARAGASATLLGTSTNAEVLIAGGSSDGTANGALNSGELFDPTGNGNANAGTFTLITGASSTLSANRWQPEAALLLGGKVLIAGGQNSGGALASADLYDPVANAFTESNHSMAQARANGSAVALPNGMVLLAGGTTSQTVDLYDADSDQFDATGSVQQSDSGLVSVLLNNGQVLVVGLTSGGTPQSDAELYSPSFNPLGTVAFSSSEATDSFGSACVLAPNSGAASTCSSTVTAVNVATSPHTITGTYPADAVHSGSSNTASLTVNNRDTNTTLTSSVNPSVFGQPVTFTATVMPVTPGAGTPTGTITFLDGGSPIGTGTLSGGVATLTTSALAVGSHTITTSYGGDVNFNGSTGSLTGNPQVVSKAATSTTVNSSANPSILNQSVTFTATVSVVAPGAGTPTGTVTFNDGSTALATVTLSSAGTATFSTSTLAASSHSITAAYSGDGNFDGSSGSLTQKVSYSIIVLYDQSRAVNDGATFPIKVALSDANGVDVSSSTIVLNATAVTMASGFSGTPDSPGNANPDSNFRFDSTLGTTGGYIFNLSTDGLASGTYSLQFTTGADPVLHAVMFGVAP